jgi:hypothetical protein
MVHRFFLPQKIDSIDLTYDSVAVSWYERSAGEVGRRLFVHSFLRSLSTPVISLRMVSRWFQTSYSFLHSLTRHLA